jgi:hypothetical protein
MCEKCPINYDFHGKCRVLLHAAKLRHGTDDFTSPPKEGMLRPGLNPRTWVPEASMLTTRPPKPLDTQLNMTKHVHFQFHATRLQLCVLRRPQTIFY